jgi:dTDP-4-amino-4,6-dideoxygalactose transaminase
MIWRCDLVPQYEKYKQEIDQAIQRVLMSGRYTLANEVKAFESEYAAYIGTKYAIGVANATDALTLCLMAIGVGHGDEVITTPFTAIPTVSAIIDAGATPVFVDICDDTFLMDIEKIPGAITSKTKAVMPVHIFGNVINIERLREIVGNKIRIIEDSSQSHGSRINGIQSGSMGDAGVFSFYPTKNLGAFGDGGVIVTDNPKLNEKLRLIRMYGMVDYHTITINGVNSRLDELQAAILRIKLKYLDEMNQNRNKIAKRYILELKSNLFEHQVIPENVFSNYHVFVSKFKGNRDRFIAYMDSKAIQTNIYYKIPLHLQEANKFIGYKKGDFPNAETLCAKVIALTMYPELEEKVQQKVIDEINLYQE